MLEAVFGAAMRRINVKNLARAPAISEPSENGPAAPWHLIGVGESAPSVTLQWRGVAASAQTKSVSSCDLARALIMRPITSSSYEAEVWGRGSKKNHLGGAIRAQCARGRRYCFPAPEKPSSPIGVIAPSSGIARLAPANWRKYSTISNQP